MSDGNSICIPKLILSPRDLERFWSKVTRGSADECWVFKTNQEYGAFYIGERRILAHRLSFQIHRRLLAAGELCCHKCDNPPCVNPDHLFAGSDSDNVQDCIKKGRHWPASMTECLRGHPLTGDNLVVIRGKRCCRECRRMHNRKTKHKMSEFAKTGEKRFLGRILTCLDCGHRGWRRMITSSCPACGRKATPSNTV